MRTSGARFRTIGRSTHRCQTLQVNPATHVAGKVLETCPHPHQPQCCEPTSRPCRCVAPRRHALPEPETGNASGGPLSPNHAADGCDSPCDESDSSTPWPSPGFNLFRPSGAVRPHTACRVVQRQLGCRASPRTKRRVFRGTGPVLQDDGFHTNHPAARSVIPPSTRARAISVLVVLSWSPG